MTRRPEEVVAFIWLREELLKTSFEANIPLVDIFRGS
jgi:hypothetical protein